MTILDELRIPRMGSVENAKLVGWRVAEGTRFKAGDVLCEIETDKTVTDLPAEHDGILARRLAAEDAELKVGDLIGLTTRSDASAQQIVQALAARDSASAVTERRSAPGVSAASQRSTSAAAAPDTSSPMQHTSSVAEAARISPYARRLAKERGIDPRAVPGTGPAGRITGDDVLQLAARGDQTRETAGLLPAGYDDVPVARVPHSTRRRAIARRLADSARAAPHLTADMEIDLTALLAARERSKSEGAAGNRPVSMLAYIAHATARLLMSHRDLNATFTDAQSLQWQVVNLGIAVDTKDGLIVPVIRNAESRTVREMAEAITDVAERARLGTLANHELEGGTFTISNPGSLGPVLRAEAILNPPQVALLGLPAMVHVPVAVETSSGEYRVEIRPRLRASLTFDHRALDGGHVIRFLNDLKTAIESL